MTFVVGGRTIQKIGVIGSGQIGPDIALYFAKVLPGVPVHIVDISAEALERGRKKLDRKIDKGIETGAFASEQGNAMKAACRFGADYQVLADADFVVEAATENQGLKQKIFAQLEQLCSATTVFASNSSHLEPEVIFASLKDRSRALVIHYFFPAERNPVVEIVPGAATSPALTASVMHLYEQIGKVPIQVKSRFGYALDPIFEGVFHAAALLVERGLGTSREVDAVACRALDLTVGPFTAMNLTGGNPITHPALSVYAERISPWFRSTALLARALDKKEPWEVPARGEQITLDPARAKSLIALLRGAFFGLVTEILDSGVANIADLDMATELALDLAPPFRLMNEIGVTESLHLVEKYAREFPGFKVPRVLRDQAASGKPWHVPTIIREDLGNVAVLKIRRPKVLNALNEETFAQLEQQFRAVEADPQLIGAVLTGFGVKAFVSGADVNFLAAIESEAQGEQTSLGSQRTLNVIENLRKPVVCAMNGFAFGGGNELAMACHARIARKGLKILAAQPEPNLGIIPGAGATQRLPRLIGLTKASELLRNTRSVSSSEACALGLVSREVDGDLVAAAVAMVRDAQTGKSPLKAIEKGPLKVPRELPPVDIGHRSRAVDAILCRAILEGCRLPLAEGLAFEAKMFGAVCGTRDMRIGVSNFIEKGPRALAAFVHG